MIIGAVDVTKIIQPIIHKSYPKYDIAGNKLKYLIKNNINKNKFSKPKDLLITTVSTYKKKSLFEKSLDHIGIKDYHVIGKNKTFKKWYNFYKIQWIYEFLNNYTGNEKYLLFSDARDAIIQDDPNKILDIYKSKKCKLLFNGVEYNISHWESYLKNHIQKYGFIDKKINDYFKNWKPITQCCKRKNVLLNQIFDYAYKMSDNNTVFLNSGGYIGEVEYIKYVFGYILDKIKSTIEMVQNTRIPTNPSTFNDQAIITHFRCLFPDIKVDTYFEVWWRDTFNADDKRCWNPPHKPPYKKGKSLYIV